MPADIKTVEPDEFTIGDTVQFKILLSDYLPSDGWTLTYYFVKDGDQQSIAGSDNGDGYHLITLDVTASGAFTAGLYRWKACASKRSERYTLRTGRIEAKPDYALATEGLDDLEHVKKVLDALEATILGKASVDQLGYSIEGRSLDRIPPEDLLRWRDLYRAEYNSLLQSERTTKGLGHSGRFLVRFVE
ncbi:MAG: hypothetical protein KJ970_13230 [Candidatus Eisenbacteria bacterium]|uniref:Uncharacterized protein n=1 Tax=Eiseniibacteriota bacterium TaxID=2212470 RepID=A0A948RYE8_UNCEI|nr:hypothetical protein [Candidatus Eisenbacteria bacterium]MBU1948149.1 hypothetical protein [Candidatus Eisenbacteria bacterium]MBU2691877.1 hypothetical protein [Candidatus Eisenbacteria bacterium]